MLQHMIRYSLERPTISRNEYGEEIKTYNSNGYIDMLIAYQANIQGEQNGVMIDRYTHIGLTTSAVKKGDLIGNKFEVMYVLDSKPYVRAFLKEVEYA